MTLAIKYATASVDSWITVSYEIYGLREPNTLGQRVKQQLQGVFGKSPHIGLTIL